MSYVSEYLAVVLLLAVCVVLFMGISVMVGGSKGEARESDRLMMWRVVLQAIALLVLIAGAIYFF